jgi:hypothetical protein
VPGQIEQAAIIDHETIGILPENSSFHPIVEDLPGSTAKGLERGDMAAQHGAEILVDDERAQISRE